MFMHMSCAQTRQFFGFEKVEKIILKKSDKTFRKVLSDFFQNVIIFHRFEVKYQNFFSKLILDGM